MSLSNKERFGKMVYTTNRLVQLKNEIDDELRRNPSIYPKDTLERLSSLIDSAWHFVVGDIRNGAHWILGSSTDNKINEQSLWGIAVLSHIEENRPQNKEQREQMQKFQDDNFDPLDGFLDIYGLLNEVENGQALIFKAHAITEDGIYAVRRYQDEFSACYEKFSKLMSDIQGVCFEAFSEHEIFAKAYLANEIFKIIYSQHCNNPHKIVREIALKQCWHHDLSRIMNIQEVSFDQVMQWHNDLYNKTFDGYCTDINLVLRIAMEIMGRRYNYKHQFEEMKTMLKDTKDVDIVSLQKLFKQNETLHDTREKEQQQKYSLDSQSSYLAGIYGYEFAEKWEKNAKEFHDKNEQKNTKKSS
jgi:hypothetical protein